MFLKSLKSCTLIDLEKNQKIYNMFLDDLMLILTMKH